VQIVRPVSALLVIDVQNDFISGSLSLSNCAAKQNGEEVKSHFAIASNDLQLIQISHPKLFF